MLTVWISLLSFLIAQQTLSLIQWGVFISWWQNHKLKVNVLHTMNSTAVKEVKTRGALFHQGKYGSSLCQSHTQNPFTSFHITCYTTTAKLDECRLGHKLLIIIIIIIISYAHGDTICPCPSPPPWAPKRLARRRADATKQYFPTANTFPCWLLQPPYTLRLCWVKRPGDLNLWPSDLESGVRVTCDVGYLCANFCLPSPLFLT